MPSETTRVASASVCNGRRSIRIDKGMYVRAVIDKANDASFGNERRRVFAILLKIVETQLAVLNILSL